MEDDEIEDDDVKGQEKDAVENDAEMHLEMLQEHTRAYKSRFIRK